VKAITGLFDPTQSSNSVTSKHDVIKAQASNTGFQVTPNPIAGSTPTNIFPANPNFPPVNPITYVNQWTTSGEKKPLTDPSKEAAKYWQRVKGQGYAHQKGVKQPGLGFMTFLVMFYVDIATL